MRNLLMFLAFISLSAAALAKGDGYWQQHADYTMKIDVNAEQHQYAGYQKLVYTNNSPDALSKVFYHLYFNAFQPGSMMDVRSRNIEDPDPRVGDRIYYLSPEEEGWIRVKSLKMNGKPLNFKTVGTILEVALPTSIAPGKKVTFEMTWDAQVPLQVRRSGRDNSEGVEFSMSQWYPKMCEFDHMGWHANPYVGREFYGIWGDFDVEINIDESYILGGTGIVVNGDEVGHGYGSDKAGSKAVNGKLNWHFKAENVHDFVWAADPDYLHYTAQVPDGPVLHFLYQDDPEFNENWEVLGEYAIQAFSFMSKKFGDYPYPQYSIIQAGDGGMEYPMATLITGKRNLRSLVGVTVHEAAHSWYHGVLATNEALYEWMDEGFTSYATSETMGHLFSDPMRLPHSYAYQGYYGVVREGKENPLSTHADHYTSNYAYGIAAYSKGEVLLDQLGYIIGTEARDQGLLEYFEKWKFKHPHPNDFKRVMEDVSELELDWYFEYFVNTIHTIDYAISTVRGMEGQTFVTLERKGVMPMPIDVKVTYTDGQVVWYYMPLQVMRGEKAWNTDQTVIISEDWPWTNPYYELVIDADVEQVARVEIDPAQGMADIDRTNNSIELDPGEKLIIRR